MSFMEPEITEKCDWLEIGATLGTHWVLAEDAPHWPIPTDIEVPGEFIDPEILDKVLQYTEITAHAAVDYIKLIRGYGARFSAPGYLDCTEWCVFKTLKEARNYLKEQEDDDE